MKKPASVRSPSEGRQQSTQAFRMVILGCDYRKALVGLMIIMLISIQM